jgi:hypothetical protein
MAGLNMLHRETKIFAEWQHLELELKVIFQGYGFLFVHDYQENKYEELHWRLGSICCVNTQ